MSLISIILLLTFNFYLFLYRLFSQFISLLFQPSVLYDHLPTHHSLPQRLSPHPNIHFPVLPFHHSLTLRNIVLDCLADAVILGLYLHNHISYLHSWVLTEARQAKHHTRGDKTMEAHLELRPGLSLAPCHYQKHCWPFFHLANASMSPSPLPSLRYLVSQSNV